MGQERIPRSDRAKERKGHCRWEVRGRWLGVSGGKRVSKGEVKAQEKKGKGVVSGGASRNGWDGTRQFALTEGPGSGGAGTGCKKNKKKKGNWERTGKETRECSGEPQHEEKNALLG